MSQDIAPVIRPARWKRGTLSMQKISLPYVFELALRIDNLSSLSGGLLQANKTKVDDVYFRFLFVSSELKKLLDDSAFSPYIRICEPLGRKLLIDLEEITSIKDMEHELSPWHLSSIQNNYNSFKTALLAELESFNTYLTTNKGGYDMHSLISKGEVIFPNDLIAKVPEAITDAREAARALAFELPTSCGFHAFRVMESVLRRYYLHVTEGKAPPKVRSIGVYVHALRQIKKGDERILSALKQMADLHRNPLIHPEVVLSTEEAISVLGIARSVITAMLATLPIAPLTVTSPQSFVGVSPI